MFHCSREAETDVWLFQRRRHQADHSVEVPTLRFKGIWMIKKEPWQPFCMHRWHFSSREFPQRTVASGFESALIKPDYGAEPSQQHETVQRSDLNCLLLLWDVRLRQQGKEASLFTHARTDLYCVKLTLFVRMCLSHLVHTDDRFIHSKEQAKKPLHLQAIINIKQMFALERPVFFMSC